MVDSMVYLKKRVEELERKEGNNEQIRTQIVIKVNEFNNRLKRIEDALKSLVDVLGE